MAIRILLIVFSCFYCCFLPLASLESSSLENPLIEPMHLQPANDEEVSASYHKITLQGQDIEYTALAGTMNLLNDKQQPKASIFFVAYMKKAAPQEPPRPISFCFNGGPGAAAVWLHMGMLGPKRVVLNSDSFTPPPYSYVDNEYSLLDITDLVFIDPVSTGYSRPAPGEDAKQFHGVEEDIKSVAEFIHRFTTRYARWDSPKYIVGESYGSTRAAGLAQHLIDQYKFYLNGVVLVSSILNFQTLDFEEGNDLAYIMYLPTYTATAWYHHKLPEELQGNLQKTLAEAEKFALNDYALALLKGDSLEPAKRKEVVEKLARFTGLSQKVIETSNLRIDLNRFACELLREQKQIVGRFDSRFVGYQEKAWGDDRGYDPSAMAIFGAFTATFMDYVRRDLKWMKEDQYKVLTSVYPWNYGNATNSYLNMSENLRNTMFKNPALKVYVASGYYDLATPYFATKYTFDHLGLDPSMRNNVSYGDFEAGHMMYIHKPALEKLKSDLTTFYNQNKVIPK
jgi:carboxypeptidase C (cathepsin A)